MLKINEKFLSEENATVKLVPFPEIENAYIIISARKRCVDDDTYAKIITTFFYGTEKGGAEWGGDGNPITVITPCDENYNEEFQGKAEIHFIYPFCTGHGKWFQGAVESEGLADAFLLGDYEHIFHVLKKFSGVDENA